jgi:hypothetical protein
MSPEQQRIAIAEACGWQYNIEGIYESWFDPAGSEWQVMHRWQTYKDGTDILPDYLADLNAMHGAEKMLESNQEQSYFELLHDIAGNLKFYRATAAQRAEAFLKTLNLWKP